MSSICVCRRIIGKSLIHRDRNKTNLETEGAHVPETESARGHGRERGHGRMRGRGDLGQVVGIEINGDEIEMTIGEEGQIPEIAQGGSSLAVLLAQLCRT